MESNNKMNELNRAAWDSYQEDYMKYNLLETPDYYEFFRHGGVRDLDQFTIDLVGDVRGLKLLDTCCACDAMQSFSWNNLGACVTACDISSKAIEIARKNAEIMELKLDFIVADAQTLEPIDNDEFDIVFATYPVWLQDLRQACKTWNRVLRKGGRLVLVMEHPITCCIKEKGSMLEVVQNYNVPTYEIYERFTGTPLSDRHGGFISSFQSVEHFYRISDVLNAIINAEFSLKTVYESECEERTSKMSMLPSDIVFIAEK